MTPVLLMISAPSGAGKTTVCDGLLAQNPNLRRVVTCTTRAPRSGELDGVHYHFLSEVDFAQRVAAGEFLEHATVYGRSYGTLKSSVVDLLNARFDVLLTIDVQGSASVRRLLLSDQELKKSLASVFLTTESWTELENRLKNRGSETSDAVDARLRAATLEVAQWDQFDYLIVSKSREEDLKRAQSIYDAERLRTPRAQFRFLP
jgi:guanylate kinase